MEHDGMDAHTQPPESSTKIGNKENTTGGKKGAKRGARANAKKKAEISSILARLKPLDENLKERIKIAQEGGNQQGRPESADPE